LVTENRTDRVGYVLMPGPATFLARLGWRLGRRLRCHWR
jgi:hypothetical protein